MQKAESTPTQSKADCVEPFGMIWAERDELPSSPIGNYDPSTQLWLPSVVCSPVPPDVFVDNKTCTGDTENKEQSSLVRHSDEETRREHHSCRASQSYKKSGHKTVLIVTRQFDPHADVVITALDKLNVEALRVNSEDFLNACSFSWNSHGNQNKSLTVADRFTRHATVPSGVIAGYYRRPLHVSPHAELSSTAAQSFSSEEGDAFLESVYASHNIRWVSPPHLIRAAEAKLPQLQLARRLGLQIPRTIVTNNPIEAHQFASEVGFNIITKPLMTSTIECDGGLYDIFTKRLSRDELETHIDSVRFAPTVIQEFVPKSTEIRVTIIGSDTFATEIDSQSVEGAESDWRQINSVEIPHKPVSLPASLTATIRHFLNYYGLYFGALDFIKTPDGQYVFLENNPNGVWYWQEILTGQPMAASMAQLLTQTSNNP